MMNSNSQQNSNRVIQCQSYTINIILISMRSQKDYIRTKDLRNSKGICKIEFQFMTLTLSLKEKESLDGN